MKNVKLEEQDSLSERIRNITKETYWEVEQQRPKQDGFQQDETRCADALSMRKEQEQTISELMNQSVSDRQTFFYSWDVMRHMTHVNICKFMPLSKPNKHKEDFIIQYIFIMLHPKHIKERQQHISALGSISCISSKKMYFFVSYVDSKCSGDISCEQRKCGRFCGNSTNVYK